jgi:hypothetical protein
LSSDNHEIKEIFKKARSLDKDSRRTIFIDGKIIIFRNEEKIIHKTSKKLTS